MGISLYTSRVVLNVLGVEDYGLYNVVGGIVALFTFINSAMASATQRYLAFDLGKNDYIELSRTFYSVVIIHFIIGLVIVILCETIGLWYILEKLQFSKNRTNEVQFVFHLSVISIFVSVIQVPFNALLISYEKMKIYAFIGIFEVVLKLLIVIFLSYIMIDKLKLYSILTLSCVILIFTIYFIYTYKFYISKWPEQKFVFNKTKFSNLISYSGWNLFENFGAMSRIQGHNLILNSFFGPKVNASYSISLQIQYALNLFVNNIQLAISPQIIKRYAQGLVKETLYLIFQGSRYCFFIMLLLVVPLYFNIDFILNKWLIVVPEHTIIFSKLSLIVILIDSLSGPVMAGIQATGKIKLNQIVVGTLLFINLPISYLLILITNKPEAVFISSIGISLFTLSSRFYFLWNTFKINYSKMFFDLLIRVGIALGLIVLCSLLLNILFDKSIILQFLSYNLLLLLILVLIIVFIGLNMEERKKCLKLLYQSIQRSFGK